MLIKHLFLAPVLLLSLVACVETTAPVEQPKPSQTTLQVGQARTLAEGKASFKRVSKRILPYAKQACRKTFKARSLSKCNFRLLIRAEDGNTPDARFAKIGPGGPAIIFNHAMLKFLRDDDEMAMVVGHEMAHQIGNHIERGQRQVIRSAINGAATAKKAGKDVEQAAVTAANTALVSFSRKYELEADRAGTVLMMRAGYTPDKAINLLDRLPSKDNKYRRHPLQAVRKEAVRAVAKNFRQAEKNGQALALSF
jgi:predicted Zn-dependent protease